MQFKELNIRARQELEEKYNTRSVKVVKDDLTFLPASIAREHQKYVTKLNSRTRPFINLTQFFRHLNLYCWNFFEYSVLENVIDSNCSEELKERMSAYVRDIEHFRKSTTITEFIECKKLPMKGRRIPPRFERVTVEHAIDPDVYTLADLDHFRKDTYKSLHLKLSECAFQVYKIKHGCVIVKWMVPEDFVKPLNDLFDSETGQRLLLKHHVEKLYIAKRDIPIPSPSVSA